MIEYIIGIIVTLLGVFMYGKSQGKKQEVDHKVVKGNEVKRDVEKLDDVELDKRASKWVRNKDR